MTKNREEFQKLIWDFYRKNKRDLPWRRTVDPYKILVSEIMLQQTQVSRVLTKYKEFITRFPDFKALARSSLSDVLLLWSGLGYNRRALFLQKTAKIVHNEYRGKLPKDPKILESFPGLGKATAASIIVFSFNQQIPFIETNIRRVFIHHFFSDSETVSDKEIYPLVVKTIDSENPREWYYALMDYGSFLGKSINNPNKKSKMYVVQSKFEGSLRQVRGKILRELLKQKSVKKTSLEKTIGTSKVFFDKALLQLAKEGFIEDKNDTIRIVNQEIPA